MKKTIRNMLLVVLAMALVSVASVIGTIAYLQDEDGSENVMTLGNVYIDQHEYEREIDENGNYVMVTSAKYGEGYKLTEFTQAKPLYPAVGTVTGYGKAVYFDQLGKGASGGQQVIDGLNNIQDKFVLVENIGKNPAYVRTIVAFELGDVDAADFESIIMVSDSASGNPWKGTWIGVANIGNNNYYLLEYVYTGYTGGRHDGGKLPAGEWTYANLAQIYMTGTSTNEDCEAIDGNDNGTYDVLVFSQAVQTAGFEDAKTALDVAFGITTVDNHPWTDSTPNLPAVVDNAGDLNAALKEGKDAILLNDVSYKGSQCLYGVADTKVNGGILDGKGNTLNVTRPDKPNSSGRYDYTAVSTTGGTIKNLTIEEGFRGIFLEYMTEDLYIDNVKLSGEEVCYTINTGANQTRYSLYVTNSILDGWTSVSQLKSASFVNCSFGQGQYYTDENGRLLKPYIDTVIEDSSFVDNFYLDLSSLESGAKITIKNCTVNGSELNASVVHASTNWAEFEGETFFIELPSDGRTLSDCVIFE